MARISAKEQAHLRKLIEDSLRRQGFRVQDGRIIPPRSLTKDRLRRLHRLAVRHRIEQARPRLARFEDRLLRRIASLPKRKFTMQALWYGL